MSRTDRGTSEPGPYRDYGFDSTTSRDHIIPLAPLERESQLDRDDLGLLASTIERLDAELETDIKEFSKLEQKTKSRGPDNLQLLQGAMKRVTELESELKSTQRRAQRLELQLQYVDRGAHAIANEPLFLEENKRLKEQIMQMEQFLADYGYIWVGQEISDSEDSLSPDEDEVKIDWRKVIENVEELNHLCGKDKKQIVQQSSDGKTTRLQDKVEDLDLALYADGILLGRGPFRSIPHCYQFLRDLQDGFFPTELQSRFPQGLLFRLKDFHTQPFGQKFPGLGKSLHDPVIRTNDPRLIETEISKEMKTIEQATSVTRVSTSKGITIRVRTLEDKYHMIRMRPSETIKHLREYIRDQVGHDHFRVLSLQDAGWKEVVNEAKTLEELKLGPRATVQLAPASRSVYDDLQSHISNIRSSSEKFL